MMNPQNTLLFPTVSPLPLDLSLPSMLIPVVFLPLLVVFLPPLVALLPLLVVLLPFPVVIPPPSRRCPAPTSSPSPLPLIVAYPVLVQASLACRPSALTCST